MQLIKFGFLGKKFSGSSSIKQPIPQAALIFKGVPILFKNQYITFKNV